MEEFPKLPEKFRDLRFGAARNMSRSIAKFDLDAQLDMFSIIASGIADRLHESGTPEQKKMFQDIFNLI